jgi:3-dehydroquinate dehydratase-2
LTAKCRQHRQLEFTSMAKNLLLLNVPKMKLSGTCEPEVYGSTTLAHIEQAAKAQATVAGEIITTFQSNDEGALIELIHTESTKHRDATVVNPTGLSHTHVALRDALVGVAIPFEEVPVSRIRRRAAFRRKFFLSDVAAGVICGLDAGRYPAAIDLVLKKL